MLTTFLGLISASILPTVSLLVGSMSAVGRSVFSINALHDEFSSAITDLWAILLRVAFTVVGLALAAFPADFIGAIPILPGIGTGLIVQTMGQTIAGASLGMALVRVDEVPRILRRALEIRYEIAIDEARRKLAERAPDSDAVAKMFPTRAGFGATKPLGATDPAAKASR